MVGKKPVIDSKFYTDGGIDKVNGFGGLGIVHIYNDDEIEEHSIHIPEPVTNQVAEMMAVFTAIEIALEKGYENIEIYSDSAYIVNCYVDKWYKKWIKNGWKNNEGKDLSNKEIWLEILPFFKDFRKTCAEMFNYFSREELERITSKKLTVTMIKVKGHSNDKFNNLADSLATKGKKNLI